MFEVEIEKRKEDRKPNPDPNPAQTSFPSPAQHSAQTRRPSPSPHSARPTPLRGPSNPGPHLGPTRAPAPARPSSARPAGRPTPRRRSARSPHSTARVALPVSLRSRAHASASPPSSRNGRARHAVFPGGISHARRARQGRRRPIRRVPGPPPNLIFHQRATRNPKHTATPSSAAKGPLRRRGSAAPPQHRPPGSHTCSVSPSRTAPCRRIEGSARAAPDFPSTTRRR